MPVNKLLIALIASATSAGALAATPTYTATFATPGALDRIVSSDRLWACDGNLCLAGGEATSPARHICTRLAKAVGPIATFSFKVRALDAEQVAQCNLRAGHTLGPAAAR